MSKVTEILKIMYPDGVPTDEIPYFVLHDIPEVEKLIGVDKRIAVMEEAATPLFTKPKHIPQVVKAPIEEPEEPLDYVVIGPLTPIPLKKPEIEPDIVDKGLEQKTFEFKESLGQKEDKTWEKTKYEHTSTAKKGNVFIIHGKQQSRVNTTWSGLNEFYNSLPEMTKISTITGISVAKSAILCEFFVDHQNFP